MKKLFAVLLLLVMIPACASAFYNPRTGWSSYDPQPFYGTLKKEMETRMGPGTEYVHTGFYGKPGDRVKIISVAYDVNNVAWVQVEVNTSAGKRRLYTGAKRFDYIDYNAVYIEEYKTITAHLDSDHTPQFGPGSGYAMCDFWLKKGSPVMVNDCENGFDLCDFYSGGKRYRVFISDSGLY